MNENCKTGPISAECPNEGDNSQMDARIREAEKRLQLEVPAGFTERVMEAVHREHLREAAHARRMRWIRRASAIAAAVLIVPVVAITMPTLMRLERKADEAAPEAERVLTATGETAAPGDVLFSQSYSTAPDSGAPEDILYAVGVTPETTAGEEELPTKQTTEDHPGMTEDTAEAKTGAGADTNAGDDSAFGSYTEKIQAESVLKAPLAAAPEYVSRPSSTAQDAIAVTTSAEILSTASEEETAAPMGEILLQSRYLGEIMTVIRSVAGEAEFDLWVSRYTGADEDAPAHACRAFGITEASFTKMAVELGFVFPEKLMDSLFENEE